MQKVLIIEDEQNVLDVVQVYIEKAGYEVYTAINGNDGLALFNEHNPDIIVLDLMLPDISGEEICQAIRRKSNVPILMLTAKSTVDDRITGLSLGADDYLIKPFSPRELVIRVRTILRRSLSTEPLFDMISFNNNDLKIDAVQQQVYKNEQFIALTALEYKLLMLFVRHPNKVFSREELIDKVMGLEFKGYDRTIDAHIKNIRKKIEKDPKKPIYICTVFGMGYRFEGEQL
ncbi:response regulator transcription factor [Vallitalea okinawensis]|uniref:response regulator transcription factor n=1 Tax=Vallitalea okinawensis TaxID=2078660 RepID=UPI000CFD86E4|nr:response regulator transcription factor [Vallitalea okinawensis]